MNVKNQENVEDNGISPSREIFNHGLRYYKAYLKTKDDPDTQNPSDVLLSFAIEIFLKCLETKREYKKHPFYATSTTIQSIEDEPIPRSRRHDLTELFERLSEETKEDITSSYRNLHYRDFLNDLDAVKTGFIDWRYIYEGNVTVIHLSALQCIGDFLAIYSENFFINYQKTHRADEMKACDSLETATPKVGAIQVASWHVD